MYDDSIEFYVNRHGVGFLRIKVPGGQYIYRSSKDVAQLLKELREYIDGRVRVEIT